jgi:hypothetical protein
MGHDCTQDERIRDLTARMDRQEERTLNIVGTLGELKTFQNKLMWAMLTASVSSIISLIGLIFKIKGV